MKSLLQTGYGKRSARAGGCKLNSDRVSISVEVLDQMLSTRDRRQLAEVALQAISDMVPADHCSAMLFNMKTGKAEDYFFQSRLACG